MTPSGIEPTTSRLVAQYLNQLLGPKVLNVQNLFLFYENKGYMKFVQRYVVRNLPVFCESHITSFEATGSIHIHTCR